MSETGLKHLMETRVPFSEYRKLADTVARLRAINKELMVALGKIARLPEYCGCAPQLAAEALAKAKEQV